MAKRKKRRPQLKPAVNFRRQIQIGRRRPHAIVNPGRLERSEVESLIKQAEGVEVVVVELEELGEGP